MATNITWHPSLTRAERSVLRRQRGFTIWLTGLSASGKSTIATALEQHLLRQGYAAYRLDGDNVRFGLNRDLGFGAADRAENIRRIAEVARLFADACVVAITSFISPYRADRRLARELHAATAATTGTTSAPAGTGGVTTVDDDDEDERGIPFIEVFVDIPLELAEQRDPKGLYKKARAGEIRDFTGVSAPYEAPDAPEIHLRTDQVSVEQAVVQIVRYLEARGLLVRPQQQQQQQQQEEEGNKTG